MTSHPLCRKNMKHHVDIFINSPKDFNRLRNYYDSPVKIGVEKEFLPIFIDHAAHAINYPYILYVFDHDWNSTDKNTPSEYIQKISNFNTIQKIFYEDPDKNGQQSNKIRFLPIGFESKTVHMVNEWQNIAKNSKPTSQRKLRACLAFGHNYHSSAGDHQQNRNTAHQRSLQKESGIDVVSNLSRLDYMRTISEYAFAISPFGHGLDCHRTWELLLMRTIPIVETSQLDPLFENLPVVIVNSWQEITEENLKKWLPIYAEKFWTPHEEVEPYLTVDYWTAGNLESILNN